MKGGGGENVQQGAVAISMYTLRHGNRERTQYCLEGKVCARKLASHTRTLPGVEAAVVLFAYWVRVEGVE